MPCCIFALCASQTESTTKYSHCCNSVFLPGSSQSKITIWHHSHLLYCIKLKRSPVGKSYKILKIFHLRVFKLFEKKKDKYVCTRNIVSIEESLWQPVTVEDRRQISMTPVCTLQMFEISLANALMIQATIDLFTTRSVAMKNRSEVVFSRACAICVGQKAHSIT
jgi:hypothetical protein